MPHRVLKARVLADLKRSRTPRQIVAGTPRVEACDGSLENLCKGSPSSRRK